MNRIFLERMQFYANHGLFNEETIIGGNYEVTLEIETDFLKGAISDELEGTIDYSKVYELIQKEMAIPSKLIEHLAKRIIDRIKNNFPEVNKLRIKLSKINPPIKGSIERVSVEIEE